MPIDKANQKLRIILRYSDESGQTQRAIGSAAKPSTIVLIVLACMFAPADLTSGSAVMMSSPVINRVGQIYPKMMLSKDALLPSRAWDDENAELLYVPDFGNNAGTHSRALPKPG